MSAFPELQKRASDPATAAQDLADLAAAHPELQPAIALNPSTYAGLLDWLRQYGAADVQAALEARERGQTPVAPPPPPPPAVSAPPVPTSTVTTPALDDAVPTTALPASAAAPAAPTTTWVEPSRSVPITYLTHDLRYTFALVGVGLAALMNFVLVPVTVSAIVDTIFNGGGDIDYAAAETQLAVVAFLVELLPWLVLGAAVFVLPAHLKNKVLALALLAGAVVIQFLQMLAAVLAYGLGMNVYIAQTVLSFLSLLFPVIAIAAWLAARMRPGSAFALLPIALLSVALQFFTGGLGYWLSGYYGSGFTPLGILFTVLAIGVLVGIAWLARLVAARKATALSPVERAAAFEAQQHSARVAHVQQWEAAYAAAHGGEAPPPGSVVPPMAAAPAYGASPSGGVPSSGGTNVMAILALVFGVGGGVLGIVFGHVALGQIKRTGEQGRGLALAGLICGYLGAAVLVIILIVYGVLIARSSSYYY